MRTKRWRRAEKRGGKPDKSRASGTQAATPGAHGASARHPHSTLASRFLLLASCFSLLASRSSSLLSALHVMLFPEKTYGRRRLHQFLVITFQDVRTSRVKKCWLRKDISPG
ncbi:uncharacterized protein BO80DRAFT_210130 [Aspergillus ibericus CBS 121593]|uniref:Uncharacterized protein n=1 Tax=Aspergillus ibericus CBS 121593 TaxID=1448316 RepID=A0A395HAA7_9EURO|nr:hypothetical protein BO80DRAFT_210130 [Aspergillus ibericus CBS 121593]RAL04847.1 hypothetical protein BO80DRAFT_210130 [Aspergillus ibericus CBS 121593]